MTLNYSKYILEKEYKKWNEKLKNVDTNLDEIIKNSLIKRIRSRLSDLEKGITLMQEKEISKEES